MTRATSTRATALLLVLVASSALATPFSAHHFAPHAGSMQARNIRNLECVSRKTQEKGVCMFALSCLKLNGTHLGVCVDRFYYGSCCKLPGAGEELDLGGAGDTNDIQHPGSVLGFPGKRPVTAASVVEEEPSTTQSSSPASTAQPVTKPTQKPTTVTTSKPTPTKRPVTAATTPSKPVTSKPLPATTKKPATVAATSVKPVTQKPTVATTSKPLTTKRPVTAAANVTKPVTSKPTAATTKRPVVVTKPTPTPAPVSSPPKPSTSPPKNVTSSAKPTAPPKPVTSPVKPTVKPVTSNKPSSSPPRPVTSPPKVTTRPPASSSSKPVAVTNKPVVTKPPTKPATVASTAKPSPSTAAPVPSTSQKPSSTLSNEVLPSSSQAPVVEAVEEESNVVSGTKPSVTVKPTPPTFPSPSTVSTGRPTPPTFPRPSSSTAPPEATSAQTSTEDGWVEIGLTTTSSVTTPPAAPAVYPGSMVTEEIPTSSATTPVSPVTSSSTSEQPATTGEELALNMTDYKQVCGRRLIPDGRIVGGTRSSFGKWPWQISLRQWRTSTYLHKCGAALLNDNWAITAAHCVENVPPSDLLLRLGEHDLSTESEPYSHLERRVQIVASHPQFDSRTFEYDLALLRFYEPVDFKPNVVPICIPDNDRNFVGSNAFVTGWGRLYEDGPLPSVMQEVSVPVIENAQCETMYRSAGYIEHIPNIFICAGWKKGGFDSCEGDSGGPMVIQREDKRWVLAGVISWGIGCAEPNQPGVYTRISEFRDWINQILQF